MPPDSPRRDPSWTYAELAARFDALLPAYWAAQGCALRLTNSQTIADNLTRTTRRLSAITEYESQIQQLQEQRRTLFPKIPLAKHMEEARKKEKESLERQIEARKGYIEHLKQREYMGLPTASPPTPGRLCNDPKYEQALGYKDAEIDRLKEDIRCMKAYQDSKITTSEPPSYEPDDDHMDSNSDDHDSKSDESADRQRQITELLDIYKTLGKSQKEIDQCIDQGQPFRRENELLHRHFAVLRDGMNKLKELAFDINGNDCEVNAALKEAMGGFTSRGF